ncbi:MAG TPA: HDOD domain-containing protein [Fimbriimonas sp.]|nr:HDOD domain-containing protein [Fimbriimonas sp.]
MARTNELAVLPHVVHRVLEITSVDDCVGRDLEKTILIDPGFSSKVLVLANSAAFGLPRRVSSVREAIMFLGYRTVRSVALTVGLFDVFVGKTDQSSMRRREWWRHSVDTAVCGRCIAMSSDQIPLEDAYTSGLLHLIGKSFMDRHGGMEYELVEEMIEGGASDLAAERAVYGCDHCEVAIEAARRWDLPLSLQSGLNYLQPALPNDPFGSLRACTIVATRMASRAKHGATDENAVCPEWALERLGMVGATMAELGAIGRRAIAEAEMRI